MAPANHRKPKRTPDQILAGLYRTLDSEAPLQSLMQELNAALDSHIGALHVVDPMRGHDRITYSTGIAAEDLAAYEREIGDQNLWVQRSVPGLLQSGIATDARLTRRDELVRSRFYCDFLRPLDIDHGMAMCLWHQGMDQAVLLSVNRNRRRGGYLAGDVRRAGELLPHLRSIYAIGRRVAGAQRIAQTLRTSLQLLAIGAAVIDSRGRTVFANAAMLDLAESQCGLTVKAGGRLAATHPRSAAELQSALAASTAGLQSGVQRVVLRDPADRVIGVAVVCGVAATAAGLDGVAAGSAVLFVHPVKQRTTLDQVFALTLGLTPAEARAATALLANGTIIGAAKELGVARSTVKSQLDAVHHKTATRSLGDLIRLLQVLALS